MSADGALGQIASTGIVGALLVIALFVIRSLHNDLKAEKDARIADADKHARVADAEKDARIEDAQKFTELAMSLQKEVIIAVTKLSDIIELSERRERERELREREREQIAVAARAGGGGPYRMGPGGG